MIPDLLTSKVSSKFRGKTSASVAMVLTSLLIAGCSGGGPSIGGTTLSLQNARFHHHLVNPGYFAWEAAWATKVSCPPGWSAIDGGTNTSNGTSVGTGSLNETKDGWNAPLASQEGKTETFVSCVSPSVASKFQWVHGPSTQLAVAKCPSGYSLVGGYGVGTIDAEFPVYNNNNGPVNEWVISSGTAVATAHASCVDNSLGVVPHEASGEGSAIAGCETSGSEGYIIIGGGTGVKAHPGPPFYNYPTGTGQGGGNEWRSFGNQNTEVVAHAACAPI